MRFNTELNPHWSAMLRSDIVGVTDLDPLSVDPREGDTVVAPDGEYSVTEVSDVVVRVSRLR